MFVLRMAWRETRAAWRRLVFFFLCLAVGVAAIVTIRSVVQGVRVALATEARTLLGADLAVSTGRPWADDARARIDALAAPFPVAAMSDQVETLTMIRPADPAKAVSRLVELVGLDREYPLYGVLALEGGQPYSPALLDDRGLLVRPDLLAQLGIAVGDPVVIGETTFVVRGVVTAEPGRRAAGGFSFGTRAFVAIDDLRAAGLLAYGSRATYRLLVKMPEPDADRLARALREAFRGQFVSARTARSVEDRMGRELERGEDYLSLVGLVIVILGGIGVWSVVRTFVQQKLYTVAVLKCVGGQTRQILATYVTQVVVMGIVGSAAGVAVAVGAVAWLGPVVADATGLATAVTVTASAVAQGAGVGLLVSLLFSLVPLLQIRHVKPSLLLRVTDAAPPRRDAVWFGTTAAIGVLLVALAAWQAGSWRVGILLAIGFAAVAMALVGAGMLLVRALRPLERSRVFAVRYAARRVGRPGSLVRPVLLAVGLGAFLVIGVRVLQDGLLGTLAVDLRPDAPDMFLIDVQPDQAADLRALLRSRAGDPAAAGAAGAPTGDLVLLPVIRARVTGVGGRETTLDDYEDVRRRGGELGREFTVTYRAALADNERLVAGRFWPAAPPGGVEVSIEQGLADRHRLHVGDRIRFDILGRVFEATIVSVREVEWSDARAGGFMFVFRPGALESAPTTFVAPLKGPVAAAARARLQRDLSARFPNVSVIDLRDILADVTRVLRTVSFAVTIVGSIVLAGGVLILIGSISMTRFERAYETAVLKTLGATSGHVVAMLAAEFALLGLAAGVVGAVGATGLSWAVGRFVLDLPWRAEVTTLVAGVAAATLLVAVVGVAASLDVIRRKPSATLRAE